MVLKNKKGQALLEYLFLLTVILGAYTLISQMLSKYNFAEAMLRPIKTDYVKAYKYGHHQAEGPDEGAAKKHPRIKGNGGFRLFINPSPQGG